MFLLPYHNGMEDKRVPNASSAALAVGLGHDGKAAAQRQRHERDSSQHELYQPLGLNGLPQLGYQAAVLKEGLPQVYQPYLNYLR